MRSSTDSCPGLPLKTRSDAEKFYQARLAGQYRRENGHSYAICLKDQVPIGYVNAAADDSHDLGYGLRKEFWRRGIVTEYTLWKRACEPGDRPPGLPV